MMIKLRSEYSTGYLPRTLGSRPERSVQAQTESSAARSEYSPGATSFGNSSVRWLE